MVEKEYDIRELLPYINPACLEYQEWINVGMALKEAGYSAGDWDAWSRSDSRYHDGECYRKWETFRGCENPVTAGTIVQMAKDGGWVPPSSHELDWEDSIGSSDEMKIIESSWLEALEVTEPERWNPAGELIRYLEALFDSTENVGYVTETWEKDGKYLPTKGCFDRTAGELIQALNKCKGDIGAVIGDYNPEAGAWIRFNPLDGKGVRNENVIDFRYALVESDSVDIEKQNAILRELELPIVTLVHSGKKSLHAVVRIEASGYEEYRKRVDFLYKICNKNGLRVDTQNKNPSRLSRMPGITRNGKKQFLIDTNIGKSSWDEWKEWIEGVNDDLPEPENLNSEWDNLPELSAPLIDGVLRQGHKMLLAGPSKAGKSFALIELCIAIAEGREWFGWKCAMGNVLYVNLELDRASCLHRFRDVYTALGWPHEHISNIDIWNLRGKSVPMDKLAPKLIRRAGKKGYIAVIIDPIYKVITGDENSAEQMANFCNQFDKICTELGCATIYCHHHSKGYQGGKKSMDRSSGSGVFARDPDALIDLAELEVTDAILKQQTDKALIVWYKKMLDKYVPEWDEDVSPDDLCSESQMRKYCEQRMSRKQIWDLRAGVPEIEAAIEKKTAWRLEGTLREFQSFKPRDLWFDYPVHIVDDVGILSSAEVEGGFKPQWQKNIAGKKSPEEIRKEKQDSLDAHFESIASFKKTDSVPLQELSESMGVTEKTVRKRIKESDGRYAVEQNRVVRNKQK